MWYHVRLTNLLFFSLRNWIFPPVEADAGRHHENASKMKEDESETEAEDNSETDDLEAAQHKKKFRKDKIGFRDRKVGHDEI